MMNQHTKWKTALTVLLLSAWFGLVTGLAESSVFALKRYVLQRVVLHGYDCYWLAPATDLVLFTLLGLVIAVLACSFPTRLTFHATTYLLASIGFLSLRGISLRIHIVAWLILSAGLAQVTARAIVRRADSFHWLVRCTFVPLCGIVAAMAVACLLVPRYAEQMAVNKLPSARPGAPNIVLMVMDTVPAKRLSLYGYEPPTTPRLKRFAESGVRFDWCISTSPWTLPAHCAMFTGRLPQELGASWETPMGDTYPTLAEVLKHNGYLTAGFPANQDYLCAEFGLSRGFVHYSSPSQWPRRIVDSSYLLKTLTHKLAGSIVFGKYLGQKRAETVNQEFLTWLSTQHDDRPFFGFLNYMDAHEPYLPPEPFAARFAQAQPQSPWLDGLSVNKYSPEEIKTFTQAYEGCLAYLDDRIGNLLDELARRQLTDNTIVIIAADHGEQLGEHGLVKHCNSLYSQLLRVPLVIAFPPKLKQGLRVRRPVSLRELPATILDLADVTGDSVFPGHSLTRYLSTAELAPDADELSYSEVVPMRGVGTQTPLAKGRMTSLVAGHYHYIRNGDGREELYDIQVDADESKNLAESPECESVLEQMRQRLATVPARRPGNVPATTDVIGHDYQPRPSGPTKRVGGRPMATAHKPPR
jgi:arylsulfatase A-like enzyme